MIYSVDLTEMSGKINHVDISKYVTAIGWKQYTGRVKEKTAVFQKEVGNDFFQITIPCSRDLYDYAIAMRKVIRTLSITETKSEEQLILELLNPLSDIIRVRQISEDVERGSILFEDAISLYENAKKMLTNAALDVTCFKKIYKGRTSDVVQEFISKCRYGQTEIGSYVISLVCPFLNIGNDGESQQLSLFSNEDNAAASLTRQATKKLMESVYQVKTAIENGTDLTDLIEDDTKQISVSFIESLTNMNLSKKDCRVEINTKWAPTIKGNRAQVNMVELSHDYYNPLKSVVDKYKIEDKNETHTVEGKISLLQAAPQIENRKQGKIKMAYIANDTSKTRIMQLTVDAENYNVAIAAHRDGRTVRAIGKLVGNNKMSEVELIIL